MWCPYKRNVYSTPELTCALHCREAVHTSASPVQQYRTCMEGCMQCEDSMRAHERVLVAPPSRQSVRRCVRRHLRHHDRYQRNKRVLEITDCPYCKVDNANIREEIKQECQYPRLF